MKGVDQYLKFKHPGQVEMMEYITKSMGKRGKELINQYKLSLSKLNSSDLEEIKDNNNKWNQSFKELITKNMKPDCAIVQDLIKENYKNNILPYYKPSAEEFIRLIELTITHPTSKSKYDKIHPDFGLFYLQAVKCFISSGAGAGQ